MQNARARAVAATLCVAISIMLAGCAGQQPVSSTVAESAHISSTTPGPTATATPRHSVKLSTTSAKFVQMLTALSTDNGVHSGYIRSKFKHWVDADHDGCDTRAEVLMSASQTAVTHTGRCTIRTGKWTSVYDGVKVTLASQIDIDHMVPLAEAWRSGAFGWSAERREAFANDLGYRHSLVAVTASSNRQKSDADPANWLPSVSSFRCAYVAEWISVKWRWGLSVDSLERGVLRTLLSSCGSIGVALPVKA